MRGNRGKGWEAALVTQHDAYAKAGRAAVYKSGGEIRGGHLQKAPPDFFGVLTGGRAVLFDAKESQGATWPFAKLKRHQAIALGACSECGGLAGIALRMGGECWWVPWGHLEGAWWDWKEKVKPRARASIDAEWLGGCALRMDGADWLAVAL